MTSSPGRFSTGIDSPVTIDSSTAEAPSATSPSTGIFAGPDDDDIAHQHLLHGQVPPVPSR